MEKKYNEIFLMQCRATAITKRKEQVDFYY